MALEDFKFQFAERFMHLKDNTPATGHTPVLFSALTALQRRLEIEGNDLRRQGRTTLDGTDDLAQRIIDKHPRQ